MSQTISRALPLDWDSRTALAIRLRELKLRPGERDLVLTIADLAGDAPTWSGPRTALAARLRVTPDTISRRIKCAEQAKALEVLRLPGRPSEFRLPAIASPIADSTPRDSRSVGSGGRDLWRACGVVMGLMVELAAAATRWKPPAKPSAPKRDPRQLAFDFGETPDAPPTISAKPPTTSLATPVTTPGNPRRGGCKPPAQPQTPPPTVAASPPAKPATTPVNSPSLESSFRKKNRTKSLDSRSSYECFRRTIYPDDVLTPAGIDGLFQIGVKEGALNPDEASRHRFFAAICNLVRNAAKTPWILFRKRMVEFNGCDGNGVPWTAWGALEDDTKAHEMIRSLQASPAIQQRTSDLSRDEPPQRTPEEEARLQKWSQRFPQLANFVRR